MKADELDPMDDRLIVEMHVEKGEKVSDGGIVMPQTITDLPQTGTVVAAGPGRLLDSGVRGDMPFEPGDTVLFGKYAGQKIPCGGDEVLVLREPDVIAIVRSPG